MNQNDVKKFIEKKNELTTKYEAEVKELTESFTLLVNETFPIKIGMVITAKVPKFKNAVTLHVIRHEITSRANINIVGTMVISKQDTDQVMTVGSYPITDDIRDIKKIGILANTFEEFVNE